MPVGKHSTRISVVVDKSTHAELERIADKEDESVSSVADKMIATGLKSYQRREKASADPA